MREYIEIYQDNKEKIESFIEDTLEKQHLLKNQLDEKFKKLFKSFPSLELIYLVNCKTKNQISSNIYRHKIDDTQISTTRDYLIDKLNIKDNGFAFTKPYQSITTGTTCITVSKKEEDKIVFLDFDLEILLERLGLIEKNKFFSTVTKSFYIIAGFFMMFLSLVAIIYAGVDFVTNLMNFKLSIDTIFKPIIATTLGLAIFDLAKTILEQEVYYKSYIKDPKIEIKTLTKFLVTILIALSIETLMVVFKIAIENYDKLINALYLMLGTSLFMMALSFMIYITKKRK
ncbi:MAG: hypothetical protein ACI9TV_000863 [Sulfurimonas sp.]|jgi:hypothetical protein|uniref:PDC sensor domain-containing protein n=1 Tax=Sulfurimonas sp. TaxID=2022749 RepID=UPI0039E4A46F